MGLFDRFRGPPSKDKFAAQFMQEMTNRGYPASMTYDTENFCLRGDNDHVINLHNFYAEQCKISRSERADHLQRSVMACLTSQQELPEEYEDAKPDLRIKLWCRAMLEKLKLEQKLQGSDKEYDPPVVEVGEHLYATIVYDWPHSVQSLGKDNLETWGVSIYEAMEVAKQNLAEDNFVFAGIGERLYASATGDSYDASRLLLLDLIQKIEVQGDHVAMVPNRDTLLITGADDQEGLEMMLDLAEKASDDPRCMLFMPLRLDGDVWVDWMPSANHPLYNRFCLLEAKYFYPEYEDQRKLLDTLHEQEGTDVYVGKYTVAQKDDGTVNTYCVWSKGVDTLLPKTKLVMFFEEGKDIVASGEWDEVARIAGTLMEETNFYPPRFRVREFPNQQQLDEIGPLD